MNNNRYPVTLQGTEAQWKKRVNDITSRGHIILNQGIKPYSPDRKYLTAGTRLYWAHVQIPK